MNSSTENTAGRVVLAFCHIAGMLDIVILPLWVGGMMGTYKFDPQVAGGIVTMYLVGTLVSNAVLSRGFGQLPERVIAVIGFVIPALAFVLMTYVPSFSGLSSAGWLGVLHFIGGIGAGAGLVMVHGVIGRSSNPHRLFAIVNFGLSVWAILFFAITPKFMATMGVNAVFALAAVMLAIAAVASLIAFPGGAASAGHERAALRPAPNVPPGVLLLCFMGVVFLQTSQAITFSFVERIGAFREFSPESVKAMLVTSSFIPLAAPILAGLLQNRLPVFGVAIGGLLFHGCLAATVSNSPGYLGYAIAASLMISTVIFTHCFIFGLLAKLDPSGRTNAATPSMLMIGTAIGPILGGTVAKEIGYATVGSVAFVAAAMGAACFAVVWQKLRASNSAIIAKAA